MSSYAPSTRRAERYRDLTWMLVWALGPRVLPGPAFTWVPPMSEHDWVELDGILRSEVGSWDAVSVSQRAAGRPGFTLMVIGDGVPRCVVRFEEEGNQGVATEVEALKAVEQFDVRSFHAPRVLKAGVLGGMAYSIVEAFRLSRHRIVDSPNLELMTEEIACALSQLPRDPTTPDHWTPAHGDFTPWNLRQPSNGLPVLLDWETAGYAPAGFDRVLYEVSAAAIGRGRPPGSIPEALHGYMRDAVETRIREATAAGVRPDPLNQEILRLIEGERGE
ncbi:MAG: phosphotransferase, partial [Acidimicrobiia bacterium]|nr:phosphotransferase [Acidimicrobiia bacterium]